MRLLFSIFILFCLIAEVSAEEQKPTEEPPSFLDWSIFKSHFKKEFRLNVGYKGWMNNWSLPVSFANDSIQPHQQDASVLFKSDTELASMPTLNVRYKNFYLTTNYFAKTKYSFGRQQIDTVIVGPGLTAVGSGNNFQTPVNPGIASIKVPVEYFPTAERSEWDFVFGGYVNRNLALMLGYKQITRNYNYLKITPSVEFKGANDSKPVLYGGTTDHLYEDSEGKGLIAGIMGNVPIALGGDLSLYGHFMYGLLETEVVRREEQSSSVDNRVLAVKSSTKNYDSPYYSGEIGFAYELKEFKEFTLSSYLGYRFQRYEFRNFTQGGQTARDGTDGIILSFSASF